jgi:putative membrane protein
MQRLKTGGALGAAVGIALSAWLLHSYGAARVFGLLRQAGWFGMTAVIAFHIIQILFSALAWQVISGPTQPRPSLRDYMVLRWIREGVNNLLPVAQIGGEFVAASLLQGRGMALAPAIAGAVADLTMEMVTQIGFTLMGLGVLLHAGLGGGITGTVVNGMIAASLLAGAFLAAQWLGLAAAIEAGLMRLGRLVGWAGTDKVTGLHKALMACYRAPRRVLLAMAWQMVSWLLGTLEVCLALHFLGHDVGLGAGLAIESLGQALKAVGFAIPGALGVQEGGYVMVCSLFGLPPQVAIALSLMKRLREVVLGVPGIVAWRRMAARQARTRSPALAGAAE